jgi:elongation factor Ts
MVVAERRAPRRASEGRVGSYVQHTGLAALVEVNRETNFVARTETFGTLVRQFAEHVAAAALMAVERCDLSPVLVAEKRAAFEADVRAVKKPERMHEKIVAGKLEAFYRDVMLLEQPWVREPKTSIADLARVAASTLGEHLVVRRFVRFELGETTAVLA